MSYNFWISLIFYLNYKKYRLVIKLNIKNLMVD